MNGKELSERLKSSAPGLQVIYISGYSENVISVHGVLQNGVN